MTLYWCRYRAIVSQPLHYQGSAWATRTRSLALVTLCWLAGLLTGLVSGITVITVITVITSGAGADRRVHHGG